MRRIASGKFITLIILFGFQIVGGAATVVKKEFLAKSPLSARYIEWSDESGGTVTFGKGKPGIVKLKGTLGEGQSLDFDYHPIQVDSERRFELTLELSSEPREFQLNFRDEKGQTAFAVFTYSWKKVPPILNIKVREKGGAAQQLGSYDGAYPTEEWLAFSWKGFRVPEEVSSPSVSTAWYNHLQLNGVAALPTTGGNTVTPQLSWNPTWWLGDSFTVSMNLAVALFKYDATSRFIVYDVAPFFGVVVGPVRLEFGAGIQTWVGKDGIRPAASSFINFPLATKWFGLIEKIFGGYTAHFHKTSQVHEAKLGVGISF